MSEKETPFPIPQDVQDKLNTKREERNAEFDRLDSMGIFTTGEIQDKLREQFGTLDIPAEQIEAEEVAETGRNRKLGASVVQATRTSSGRRNVLPALGPRQLNIADGDKRVESAYPQE